MVNAVLYTRDPVLIAEFEAVCAVTGATLEVFDVGDSIAAVQAAQVFVDSTCTSDRINAPCVVVSRGAPGPDHWAIAARLRAENIVELPAQRAWLIERLTPQARADGRLIAVLPLIGGAGSSTFAVALAHSIARSAGSAAVVDADPRSGMLDMVAGTETIAGMRWPALTAADNPSGVDVVSVAARVDDLTVLSSDVQHPQDFAEKHVDVIKRLQTQVPYVVVDLPAFRTKHHMEVVSTADMVFVYVPNTVKGVALAKSNRSQLGKLESGLVVRSSMGGKVDGLEIGTALDWPVWCTLPGDPRVAEQIEQGFGPNAIKLGGYTRAVLHASARVTEPVAIADAA